jgi:hypothetical protein
VHVEYQFGILSPALGKLSLFFCESLVAFASQTLFFKHTLSKA